MKKIVSYLCFFFFLFFCSCNFVLAKENDTITVYFFHGDGCPHCASESEFLKSISNQYDNLEIVRYEVWNDAENAELLEQVKDVFDFNRNGVPFTVIGTTVFSGYSDAASSRIERAIQYYQEHEYLDVVQLVVDGGDISSLEIEDHFGEEEAKSDEQVTISVPFFDQVNLKNLSLSTAAVLIGLFDGFNPCAMWVLLFLLSVLVGMKDRKRMWCLGLTFLLTSAFVYMLIMLSWVQVVVSVTTSILLRNLVAVIAIVGGLINLKGFIQSKSKDGGCSVVDSKKRKDVFARIKKFAHEKNFLLSLIGVVALAISVNLIELACSAGLPLVFSQLLAINQVTGLSAFYYTLIYILFFLFDDLIIFFIAMFTMKVTGISTRYSKYSHLIGGILMILIGLLLLFKPEWLMFS